jgi:hypothetical protein
VSLFLLLLVLAVGSLAQKPPCSDYANVKFTDAQQTALCNAAAKKVGVQSGLFNMQVLNLEDNGLLGYQYILVVQTGLGGYAGQALTIVQDDLDGELIFPLPVPVNPPQSCKLVTHFSRAPHTITKDANCPNGLHWFAIK